NQVREQTKIWMDDYNLYRPHDALGKLSPITYAKQKRDAAAKAHFKNSLILKPL
ncbi:integrase core domain-containing protein, partial [Cognatitamlana onchidii]|uniref:integrase core domain-containing protein n=1 Tax=Cognatitamlana onchidii TaxID=2562860 RepID=UPI0037440E1E